MPLPRDDGGAIERTIACTQNPESRVSITGAGGASLAAASPAVALTVDGDAQAANSANSSRPVPDKSKRRSASDAPSAACSDEICRPSGLRIDL